jgi:hypothetical protein
MWCDKNVLYQFQLCGYQTFVLLSTWAATSMQNNARQLDHWVVTHAIIFSCHLKAGRRGAPLLIRISEWHIVKCVGNPLRECGGLFCTLSSPLSICGCFESFVSGLCIRVYQIDVPLQGCSFRFAFWLPIVAVPRRVSHFDCFSPSFPPARISVCWYCTT